jgi:two-component system sensor histidine kinase YesM
MRGRTRREFALRSWFVNKPLQAKLMLSFSVVMLVTGVLSYWIIFSVVSRNNAEQLRYSASQSYEQAYQFIESKLQTMLAAAEAVYFSDAVQSMLLNAQQDPNSEDFITQYKHMLDSEAALASVSTDDMRVSLYVPDELFFSKQNDSFFPRSALPEWNMLMQQIERDLWLRPQMIPYTTGQAPGQTWIGLLRKIRSRYDVGNVIGVLRVNIKTSILEEIIRKSSITQEGTVYVVNSRDELLLVSNQPFAERLGVLTDPAARAKVEAAQKWTSARLDRQNYLVHLQAIPHTDWKLAAVIPQEELFGKRNHLALWLGGALALFAGAVYLYVYFFSRSMTDQIRRLSQTMAQVRRGNLEVSLKSGAQDEIGRLIDNFNYMVSELRLYSSRVFESGIALKEAELRALQAQINPHFLYNTLDLINWKALDNGIPELAALSRDMAGFYRLSLNKGRDLVPLRDELEHVRLYVQIQNRRFDSRIQLQTAVPERLQAMEVPRLLFQPLIENAVVHGMGDDSARLLHIRIDGAVRPHPVFGEEFVITVADDGLGIPQQRLEELRSAKAEAAPGYGIRNIHQRLQIRYGEQWGLSVDSPASGGTIVTLRLPVLPMDEPTSPSK